MFRVLNSRGRPPLQFLPLWQSRRELGAAFGLGGHRKLEDESALLGEEAVSEHNQEHGAGGGIGEEGWSAMALLFHPQARAKPIERRGYKVSALSRENRNRCFLDGLTGLGPRLSPPPPTQCPPPLPQPCCPQPIDLLKLLSEFDGREPA